MWRRQNFREMATSAGKFFDDDWARLLPIPQRDVAKDFAKVLAFVPCAQPFGSTSIQSRPAGPKANVAARLILGADSEPPCWAQGGGALLLASPRRRLGTPPLPIFTVAFLVFVSVGGGLPVHALPVRRW